MSNEEEHNEAVRVNNLGNLELHNKNYKKALGYYKKALALNKINYIVYDNMGTGERELGHLKIAIDFYEKALKEKPDYNLAKINLKFTLMLLCDWKRLIAYKPIFQGMTPTPFLSIISEDSPGKNKAAAQKWLE